MVHVIRVARRPGRGLFYLLMVSTAFMVHSEEWSMAMRPSRAQCAEAARIFAKLPVREVLAQNELSPLLSYWDEMAGSSSIRDRHEALSSVMIGTHLRYGNSEIKDRLASLFIAEHEAGERRLLEGSTLADYGIVSQGEVYQDYMDLVNTLGYETFSPRIYEAALDGFGSGGFLRRVYLVAVNPERTLQLLLETRRRDTEFFGSGAAWLDHPTEKAHFGPVDEGLQILALLCELCPGVVAAERERILDFVHAHATFYRSPIKRSSQRPEPVHLALLDARTRDRALRILELLAKPKDIPLVEEIMRDPPLTRQQIAKSVTTSDTTVRGAALIRRLVETRP